MVGDHSPQEHVRCSRRYRESVADPPGRTALGDGEREAPLAQPFEHRLGEVPGSSVVAMSRHDRPQGLLHAVQRRFRFPHAEPGHRKPDVDRTEARQEGDAHRARALRKRGVDPRSQHRLRERVGVDEAMPGSVQA